jgi:hypothetical protein
VPAVNLLSTGRQLLVAAIWSAGAEVELYCAVRQHHFTCVPIVGRVYVLWQAGMFIPEWRHAWRNRDCRLWPVIHEYGPPRVHDLIACRPAISSATYHDQ